MNMSLISIIIPVYNVAAYLPQCLTSVINQTMRDIEIILIDDGSEDEGGAICDEYASHDSRISVIHKSNEGLSAARNDGIELSSAPFILFVDADDWIEPNLCERTYYSAVSNDADLVLFAFNKIYNDGRIIPSTPTMRQGFLTEEEAIEYNMKYAPAVWIGLYKRELFDIIQFPIGKLFEEVGTSHRLKHIACKIMLIKDMLYNYRVDRSGSIINTYIKSNHPDLREMMLRRIDDLCEWGYEELVRNDAMYLLIRYGCTGQEHLVKIAKKGSSEYNLKRKVLLFFLRISPILFDSVCIAAKKRLR